MGAVRYDLREMSAANPLDSPRGRLRERATFFLGFVAGGVWLLACSVLGLLVLLVAPRNRNMVFLFARVVCGGIVRMMGWRIQVTPRDRLDVVRPCVFVSNHQSIMDVLTFGAIVPRRTVAVGKREIGAIPLFGWFFRASGNLVIERGNSEDAKRMLAEAAVRLNEEKLSVWFMPEGHRNKGEVLLPFKTGAFRLAAAAGVPVVPVVSALITAIVDTRARRARPGTLRMRVLAPVSANATSEEELAALAVSVREAMQRELDALVAESGRP